MTQHGLDYYMNDEKKIELNSEIRNDIKENNEQINDFNGIVEVRYGNEIYRTWKVEFIRPLIIKFLKEKYPDSLIVREFSKIDITVFNNQFKNKIPVEIQKTPIQFGRCDYGNKKNTFRHASFEYTMRTQIEINIKTYNLCWLFFDSEYHRFLQSENVGKAISIDLTWIVKLMRETTLKVFTIKYDGTVNELTTKDFDFLKNISQVCSISEDNDERILNRNKLEIFYDVINGNKFTQEEITQFESEFDNRKDIKQNDSAKFYMKNNNERCKLYGNIIGSTRQLTIINNILDCVIEEINKSVMYTIELGLFYQNDFYAFNNNAQIQFTDKFNIAQYFPGYIRNKEMWDYCKKKQRIFTMKEFYGIIDGTFNYKFIKKQSTMLDF